MLILAGVDCTRNNWIACEQSLLLLNPADALSNLLSCQELPFLLADGIIRDFYPEKRIHTPSVTNTEFNLKFPIQFNYIEVYLLSSS